MGISSENFQSFSLFLELSIFLASCLISITSHGCCFATTIINENGDVLLGGIFSIHRRNSTNDCSNELSLPDLVMAEAMQYTIRKINSGSHTSPRVDIGFSIADDCHDTTRSMDSSLNYVNHNDLVYSQYFTNQPYECHTNLIPGIAPIVAVIGTDSSESSVVVANLLQLADVAQISYSATSNELSQTDRYTSFFRTVPPDTYQSQAMVELVEYFNWTYVAAISVDSNYGRKGLESFIKKSTERGICMAVEEYFSSADDDSKITKIVKTLKEADNIKVIVLYADYDNAGKFLIEVKKQNVTGKVWIGSESWSDAALRREATKQWPSLQGMIGFIPINHLKQEILDDFKNYLRGLSPGKTSGRLWWEFWMEVYKCSRDPLPGFDTCTGNERITEDLYNKELYSSFLPPVIRAVHVVAHTLETIYSCKKPYGLLSGGECPDISKYLRPEDFLLYLKNLTSDNFIRVPILDRRPDESAVYDIVNVQLSAGQFEMKNVGKWAIDKGLLLFENTLIQWPESVRAQTAPEAACSDSCPPGTRQTEPINCCWECIPCGEGTVSGRTNARECIPCSHEQRPNKERSHCIALPLTYISFMKDNWAVFLLALAVVCMLMTTFLIWVFYRHRYTALIQRHGGLYNIALLLGILLSYGLAVLFLVKPSDLTCKICAVYFYSIFILNISIIFIKTMHLLKWAKPGHVTVKYWSRQTSPTIFLACSFLVCIVFFILWLLGDPPVVQTTRKGDVLDLDCLMSSTLIGWISRIAIVVYATILLTVATIFSVIAKSLTKREFNEAKHIMFGLYILVITWLTFFPAYIIIKGSYMFFFTSVTSILAASGMLGSIFIPKLYLIVFHPYQNTDLHMMKEIKTHENATEL